MPLVFEEVHASPDKKKVNEEYFILANTGASASGARSWAKSTPVSCCSPARES